MPLSNIIDTMHPMSQALRIQCRKHYASNVASITHPMSLEASSLNTLLSRDKVEGKDWVGSRDAINGVYTRPFGLNPQSVMVWEMACIPRYDDAGVEFKQRSMDNTVALNYIKFNKY